MNLWPHQERAICDTLSAIREGERRICITSPTGGGKTAIASTLINHYTEQGKRSCVYTNRKLLVEQTGRVLELAGHEVGVRAAGHQDQRELAVQVCSLQTEDARVNKRDQYRAWQLHDADLVIVDEAHCQKGEVAKKILEKHHESGAVIVGLTATPIGLADFYDHLVVAGTNSELRDCGALVPCLHYGPDEPDLRKWAAKLGAGQDLTEAENVSAIMRPGIFGRILEWFEKINPTHKPTICFGPDVRSSLWIAEQFVKAGITAAHIDGQEVWVNGSLATTSKEVRNSVLGASRAGFITVLCNRFVLREGVDCPWLSHGIFATVFGSVQSYLQSGGRLLRAYHGLSSVTLADHGGNWHRFGSLNADRDWNLEDSANVIAGMRQDRLRDKEEPEPFRCPKCGLVIMRLPCKCGWASSTRSRPVIQSDGTLKEMHGDIYRPRRIYTGHNAAAQWERMFWRSRTAKGRRTFRQAWALFASENNWGWPARDLPFMPKDKHDSFRLVEDVPFERLIPKESSNEGPA